MGLKKVTMETCHPACPDYFGELVEGCQYANGGICLKLRMDYIIRGV